MPESREHFDARYYESRLVSGLNRHLNPTRRHIPVEDTDEVLASTGIPSALKEHPWAVHVWSTRNNRKGRHAVAIDPDFQRHERVSVPKPTNTWGQAIRGIWQMVVRYPIWDVSYDVAVVFTIGSVLWVLNSFFVWLPLEDPESEFSGESGWGGGLTGVIGASIFELGSILLMLEAVNENRTDCFGWAIRESVDGIFHLEPHQECRHHHVQKRNLVAVSPLSTHHVHSAASEGPDWASRTWSWWPTWHELRSHYFREVGFLACSAQMFGATVFWISGFTGLPPIQDRLSSAGVYGAYWLPQVIGGIGFIVSSSLFMIEVQPKWYIAAPGVLGWHVGFWNLIGSIGFTLCGALGFGSSNESVEYALTLSTFIGSWAFLVGSVVQWFESLDKYPVWVGTEPRMFDVPAKA